MLTKNKIIYDLLSLSRGGPISDDDEISLRQVGFWVDNIRSILLRQQTTKGQTLNSDVIQTISCLEVEEIDASYCPVEVVGCTILRSKKRIPNTIETEFKNLITKVSSPSIKSLSFSEINVNRIPYIDFSKVGKKLVKYFIHDRYIYLLSNVLYDKITVSGVFQFPEELKEYLSCTGEPCYTDDSYYPMSNHMVELIKKMVIENNIRLFTTLPADVLNNANGEMQLRLSK
jgi:hypothetical protein